MMRARKQAVLLIAWLVLTGTFIQSQAATVPPTPEGQPRKQTTAIAPPHTEVMVPDTGSGWLWAGAGTLVAFAVFGAYAWQRRRRQPPSRKERDERPDSDLDHDPDTAYAALTDEERASLQPLSEVVGYLCLGEPILGAPSSFPITKPEFRVGRSSNNDLTVRDPSVSRHHAELRMQRDGVITLHDLSSMNGVYLNNKRIRNAPLSEGDRIDLGDLTLSFTFLEPESDRAQTMSLVTHEESSVIDIKFSGRGAA